MEDADPLDNPIKSVSSIDNSECNLELLQDTTEASSSGIKEEAEDPLSDDLCVDTGIVLSEGSSLSKSCDDISDAYQNEFEKDSLKCELDEDDDDDEDEQLYLAMAINNMPVSVEIQEETNDAKEECGNFQGEIKEEPYLVEAEEADPLSQTSTSKRVMETSEKAKKVEWKREPTHLLIETHGIYNHLFNMGTVSNVEVWRKIASVLQDKGYPYTPDDCRKKWNSLFYRYKLVKRNKSKRGNKHTKWEHYDVMDDYMTGKPISTPPKVKETPLPTAIISKEPPKRLRFVENIIVPPQVSTQLQTFPTQQIEETSDKARRIEWKRDQTHLLIDAHRTFEHLFIVGNVSSVKVWRKIAKVLQNKGYPYTPDDCRKKWNSLIYRYKLVKRNKTQSGNKRTKWEHYDVMDKYMAGKPILTPSVEETSLPTDPDHPQPSTSSVIECKEPIPAPQTLHIKEALSFPSSSSLPVAMPTGSSILAKPSPPGDSLSHTPSPPEVLHHPQRKHVPTQLRDKKMRLEVTEEVLEQQEGSSSKQEHVRESAILRNALMDNYTKEAVKYHQQLSSQLQQQQEQILQLKQQQQSHHEVQRQQILQLQQQSQNQNEMLQQHGMQLQAIMGMLQDMQQYFRQERSQGEKKK